MLVDEFIHSFDGHTIQCTKFGLRITDEQNNINVLQEIQEYIRMGSIGSLILYHGEDAKSFLEAGIKIKKNRIYFFCIIDSQAIEHVHLEIRSYHPYNMWVNEDEIVKKQVEYVSYYEINIKDGYNIILFEFDDNLPDQIWRLDVWVTNYLINEFTYNYKGKPLQIERFGVVTDEKQQEINIFDSQLNQKINQSIKTYIDTNQKQNIIFPNPKYWTPLEQVQRNSDKYNVYIFCIINCHENTNMLITVRTHWNFKLWLNNQYLGLSKTEGGFYNFITNFKKGINVLIFEYAFNTKPDYMNSIEVRVNSMDNEESEGLKSLCFNNLYIIKNMAFILTEKKCLKGQHLKFMPVCYDIIGHTSDIVYTIYTNTGEVIDMSKCEFFKETSVLLNDRVMEFEYIVIHIDYNLYGIKRNIKKVIFIQDYTRFVTQLIKEARKVAKLKTASNFDKYNLNQKINLLRSLIKSDEYISDRKYIDDYVLDFYRFIHCLKINTTDNYYYDREWKKIYFKSRLDNDVSQTSVQLPKNHDQNKKYPLVILLSVLVDDIFCHYFDDFKVNGYIFANVNGRGITTGGYIGEASVLESIEIIKSIYQIDEDQIYMVGYSNGAYTGWSLLQSYPDITAGLCALSGVPNINNIKNVQNTKIINVSSPSDTLYESGFLKPGQALENAPDYHTIEIENVTHNGFYNYIFKEDIIADIIKGRLNKYPNYIYFRTEHNRHRKSYWIEIHGIEYSRKYAVIEAEIKNNIIYVKAENCTGFSIMLPPQINKSKFEIVVNNTFVFSYVDFIDRTICFEKNLDKYIAVNEIRNPCKFYKGTGLLDVYLNSIKIMIPEDSDPAIEKAAKSFSKPFSNGFDSNIHVKYPIYYDQEIEKNKYCNMIIFNNLKDNKFIQKLNIIQTEVDGFIYKSIKYASDYCIMQICENPFDYHYSVLVITTNNTKLLNKNLFIRKVVLPSYANGYHPYWNNEVLIFMNNKYYAIYEMGMDIQEIK